MFISTGYAELFMRSEGALETGMQLFTAVATLTCAFASLARQEKSTLRRLGIL
jgi:hypothetical protein